MKKIISFALAMLLSLSVFAIPVKAENDNGFTVEIVPNAIAEADLPEALKAALNETVISPYGTAVPSGSKIYDLGNGPYSFSAYTKRGSTIYSNYYFIGHDGAIDGCIYDDSTASGSFTFKLYKKGLVTTTVYSKKCYNGEKNDLYCSFNDSNAKVYFAIVGDKSTVDISKESYIQKG